MLEKLKQQDLSADELEEMTPVGIYLLMEEKGADTFGLWSASKTELIKSYAEQIGFK